MTRSRAECIAAIDASFSRAWDGFCRGMSREETIYTAAHRDRFLAACQVDAHGLSIHYWKDWSHIRPPICVVCPNGEQWEIDRKSSNGTGWTVKGEWPNLTCSPSIVVEGYHGFLKDGLFTADTEGRGPNGRARA